MKKKVLNQSQNEKEKVLKIRKLVEPVRDELDFHYQNNFRGIYKINEDKK